LVQLIKATGRAEVDGVPNGFWFLVTEQMQLLEPANLFLYETCVVHGRVESSDTQKTYAEALYDWFQACEDNDWVWDDITRNELSMYRNRMLSNPSPHTGRPYKRTTINGRVGTVCRFYLYTFAQGLMNELPFSYKQVIAPRSHGSNSFAHTDRSAGIVTANNLLLKTPTPEIRAIAIPDLRRILQKLGPASIRDPSDPRKSRNRLLGETSVTSGMRRLEVAALPVNQIPAAGNSNEPLRKIRITITKGNNPRTVYLPHETIIRLNWYIKLERAKVVSEAKKRARRIGHTYQEPEALFLNDDGTPMTRERITRIFAEAAEAVGVGHADFHGLRHTFAITMYKALERHEKEPWKLLQILLGHEYLSTTVNTYLRAVEVDEALVSDCVEALYNEILYA
jgi:site-specific recombinase XerD